MAYEKKNGDISVFKNTKKTAENNLPDYSGQAMVDDKLMNVALWLKFPEDKPAFLTGKIEVHVPRSSANTEDPIQDRPVYPAEEPISDAEIIPSSSDAGNGLPF